MSFELSADHELFRKVVREFAESEVRPHVAQWDRDHYFPTELVTRMGELGLFGLVVPDEFGGLGRTAFTLSLTRNRRGPCGTWTLIWDHHEHAFSALSVGVDAAASDRPDRETRRTG